MHYVFGPSVCHVHQFVAEIDLRTTNLFTIPGIPHSRLRRSRVKVTAGRGEHIHIDTVDAGASKYIFSFNTGSLWYVCECDVFCRVGLSSTQK